MTGETIEQKSDKRPLDILVRESTALSPESKLFYRIAKMSNNFWIRIKNFFSSS